jgi:hypothetical protein
MKQARKLASHIYTCRNQKQKGTCSHSSKIQGDSYLKRKPKVSHRLAKEPRIQQVPKIINQKKIQQLMQFAIKRTTNDYWNTQGPLIGGLQPQQQKQNKLSQHSVGSGPRHGSGILCRIRFEISWRLYQPPSIFLQIYVCSFLPI